MDQVVQTLYEWLATKAEDRFGVRGLVLVTSFMILILGAIVGSAL